MRTILVCFGTRPEAIKLAPVIHELAERPGVRVRVANVGQHAEMLDETMRSFGIRPDHRLEVIRPGQPLEDLTARALTGIGTVIASEEPDLVLVQGDTTTVFVSALAAFYQRVPVGHVEAGLRTGIPDLPFPEEMNRRLTAALTTLHFAPTPQARENLLSEGIADGKILVTGNTVVDALFWMLANGPGPPPDLKPLLEDPRRKVVVTAHRRESWGVPMEAIAGAIADIAGADRELLVIFPIHPNPVVRQAIMPSLDGLENVHVIEPLAYDAFVPLLDSAYLLLTDSGGIQEEAAALRKPVLVMRDVTERGEGVETGTAVLVGRDRGTIVRGVRALLSDEQAYSERTSVVNPYGDGRAAARIADRVQAFFATNA